MKVIVQIPCYNEEATIAETIRDIPREIDDVSSVEILIIDDGCTDSTVEVARKSGADHILQLGSNRGLATAFRRGIEHALELGADYIVNTDADNQYSGRDIPQLLHPLCSDEADFVVGCRPIDKHPEFSYAKKVLQKAGSWTLRRISRTNIDDAASGFRAFSRETCQRIFIHSKFSYCMETLIQAGTSNIRVTSVDIHVNPKTRTSRLFTSIPQYIWKSGSTIVTMFILYRPAIFFFAMSAPFLLLSTAIGLRFIYLIYIAHTVEVGRTYLPSLILLSISTFIGVLLMALGILGEILKSQRRVAEESLYLQRKQLDR